MTKNTLNNKCAGRDAEISPPKERFLAWPGWKHLVFAYTLSLLNGVWFLLVYAGANHITSLHRYRIRIHFDQELEMPFIPAMSLLYMSIYLLFLMGPFVLRTAAEFRAIVMTMAVSIGVAGISFLAFPADLLYAPPSDLGIWSQLYALMDDLNLQYNLMPSLHVGLSAICIFCFYEKAGMFGRWFLWAWGVGIAASTVFTHQHYLIDVIIGFLLAWIAVKLIYSRVLS